MRCLCCNDVLSDFEATRRYVNNSQFVDLCNYCLKTIDDDVKTFERIDLKQEHILHNDDDSWHDGCYTYK
jgi:hypothetical protein